MSVSTPSLPSLRRQALACTLCEGDLPHGVRPVFRVSERAKILIAGQAPGRRVHASGIPFDDPSGDRLRLWLGVTAEQFYDDELFAILPMGFCYPGTGKSGDLPPRPECAKQWRAAMLNALPQIELTLAIGKYALNYHLPQHKGSLTEIVKQHEAVESSVIPLPHPSPRNNIWLKKNAWFEHDLIPKLQNRVKHLLSNSADTVP